MAGFKGLRGALIEMGASPPPPELEQGPTPIKLGPLLALLRHYPNMEAARYLAEDFNKSFRTPAPPPVGSNKVCNLRSVIGLEDVVRGKNR